MHDLNKTLELEKANDQTIVTMDKLVRLKHRDILQETMQEYSRRGSNYIRIYPSKGCDLYDCFFVNGVRQLNRFLFKCLYTEELLPR